MAFALLQPTRHDVYPFIDPQDGLKGAAAGRSVLVTGSGTGIGQGIAKSFALAGASLLVLVGRRTEPLEETKKIINGLTPDAKVLVRGGIDIANLQAVEKLLAALDSPPDVVVSNAAVSLATASVTEADPQKWSTDIDVNIKGAYHVARAYLNAAHAVKKEGCLINVSSNASWRYVPGRASYSASKVAMNSLSEYIHREEEANGGGVRCVALHPGGVNTSLATDDLPEEIKRRLIDTPALPGGTAVYLSTDRARFLLGRFVPATWDMEELEKQKGRILGEDLLKSRVIGMMG